MKLDFASFLARLDGMEVVTLGADDAALKTEFLIQLCDHCTSSNMQVSFIDLDLQFSSYLCNYKLIRSREAGYSENLFRLTESFESTTEQVIEAISDRKMIRGGIFILDSLNSLQNEIKRESSDLDSVRANHKASIVITLIQLVARSYGKLLVISDIRRNRPVLSNGNINWIRELAGGRMIAFKSQATLSLENFEPDGTDYILRLSVKDSGRDVELFQGEI